MQYFCICDQTDKWWPCMHICVSVLRLLQSYSVQHMHRKDVIRRRPWRLLLMYVQYGPCGLTPFPFQENSVFHGTLHKWTLIAQVQRTCSFLFYLGLRFSEPELARFSREGVSAWVSAQSRLLLRWYTAPGQPRDSVVDCIHGKSRTIVQVLK